MIKQVFAGVVAIGSVSGVASAQTYISMSPPPAAFAPPSVIAPRGLTTTASSPAGDQREVTIQKLVNRKGNTGIEKGPPSRFAVTTRNRRGCRQPPSNQSAHGPQHRSVNYLGSARSQCRSDTIEPVPSGFSCLQPPAKERLLSIALAAE